MPTAGVYCRAQRALVRTVSVFLFDFFSLMSYELIVSEEEKSRKTMRLVPFIIHRPVFFIC